MQLFLTLLALISIDAVVFATSAATSLGSNAPPAIFDGWTMTAVPDDTRPRYWYSDVESLDPTDPITFNELLTFNSLPLAAWTTSAVNVYYGASHTLEIFFPQDTCAFIFYVMSNRGSMSTFDIEYASGNVISQDISWNLDQGDLSGVAVSYCLQYGQPVSVTITAADPNAHNGMMVGVFSMSQCGAAIDADGDSIPDLLDNCPYDANPGQCDYDGDGIGDVCDPCIFAGVNDADRDNDGVPDACDKCPGFDDSQDRDGDGIPDACDICPDGDNYADTDGDGIPNCIDNCVHSPNTDQVDTDGDGIGDVCEENGACCINDCNGVATGNYQSCISCSVYVTCNHGYKIDNRPCPSGLYWDANIGQVGQGGCRAESSSCDPNQQSTPCPSP